MPLPRTLYRRALRASPHVIAAVLAACGDGTAPNDGSGLYRLETVNSLALPYRQPPSNSIPYFEISSAELLLRRDGTFSMLIQGIGISFDGTYARANGELRLTVPNGEPGKPPLIMTSPASNDSIRIEFLQPPLVLLFRPSPMPAQSIRAASYVLTQANGRSGLPLTLSDTVLQGTRYVYRVEFDSLWLTDGLFFRQHRAESGTAYLANGDSIRDEDEGLSWGTYTSDGGWVVLRHYFMPVPTQKPTDSLAIGAGTLTRTTRLRAGQTVERYSRYR